LLQEAGVPANAWLGVGVSMTGLVSAKDGRNHTYFAGGAHLSLKDDLASYFGKPVYVQNDVKSAALAEYRFGLAKDQSNALVLSMDWGLGLGIIMDGKLRRGADGFAGEFGHIPLMEYGLLCHCGKTGCLETVASGLALSREALQGLRAGQRTLLREQFAPDANRIPLEAMVRAAVQGDQFSIQLLADCGRHLGKGIAILIQLLNPSRIVLTGEIAKADQYITVPLQQAINTHCMSQLSQSVRIELSQLGNQARLLGAVATVIEHVFDS
jgi:predicted NBD/HSP70 family sugar kinase